jgi:hypothetical protein
MLWGWNLVYIGVSKVSKHLEKQISRNVGHIPNLEIWITSYGQLTGWESNKYDMPPKVCHNVLE